MLDFIEETVDQITQSICIRIISDLGGRVIGGITASTSAAASSSRKLSVKCFISDNAGEREPRDELPRPVGLMHLTRRKHDPQRPTGCIGGDVGLLNLAINAIKGTWSFPRLPPQAPANTAVTGLRWSDWAAVRRGVRAPVCWGPAISNPRSGDRARIR
jgi:hypothetical protein